MTATAFTCEAPTDAQLAKLAEICDERGIAPRPVVYSRGAAINSVPLLRVPA